MDSYIDIHSHILPGLDDGAVDEEQTKAMLKMAYGQGIRIICATPHFRPNVFPISISKRQAAFDKTKAICEEMYPDMMLVFANELYYYEGCLEYLRNGKCKCYGDSRYVLVEFSTDIEYRAIYRNINTLIAEGYIPIIAHVERYDCLRKDIGLIDELIEHGSYIQVNCRSVISKDYFKRKFVKKIIEYDMVHFIASDSHNDTTRACNFDMCINYIEKKYGKEYVNKLFYINPLKMLNNEYL